MDLLLLQGRDAPAELISHEIGHRYVELEGFVAAMPTEVATPAQYRVVQQIVSLTQHVPLYRLQRDLGHGAAALQAMIDNRAQETLLVYSRFGEPPVGDDLLLYGMLMLDDLTHCSDRVRTRMETEVLAVHAATREVVQRIKAIVQPYDLLDQMQNYQGTLETGVAFYPHLRWGPSPLAKHIRALLDQSAP